MNQLIRNHISVEGLDNAFKVARTLIEQDYQVMIQLDDCDIYIVSYEHNNSIYGDNEFASLDQEECELIVESREHKADAAAISRYKALRSVGIVEDTEND